MWLSHFEIGELAEIGSGQSAAIAQIKSSVIQRRDQLIKIGLSPGKRIILYAHNSISFFVDLLACWECGACAIPLDGRAPGSTRRQWENWIQPHAKVHSPESPVLLHANAPLWPKEIALGLLTSGSSALPRLTLHSADALEKKMKALAAAIPIEDVAVSLCALPTHFGHGLICNSLFPWLHGAKLHLAESFHPALLAQLDDIVRKREVRFLSSTPAVWALAAEFTEKSAKPSLRRVHCASAMLEPKRAETLQAWASGAQVWNVYGLTEFLGWVSGAPLDERATHVGSGWSTDIRLDDKNDEVLLRAPFRMHSSITSTDILDLQREDGNGWHSTRDRGEWDGGSLRLFGRMDFVINKGGLKIQPEEVEAIAAGHPEVTDCQCGARPDPLWGEKVALAVVLKSGSSLKAYELRAWLGERLPAYKVPDEIAFVSSLMRNARGKLERARFNEQRNGTHE